MDKNEELQKWLNDDRYVQFKELLSILSMGANTARQFLKTRNIKHKKRFFMGGAAGGSVAFFERLSCITAKKEYDMHMQEVNDCLLNKSLIRFKDMHEMWELHPKDAWSVLRSRNIKPVIKFSQTYGGYTFYDRAECERARPFINQSKQKEVEKVEQVNLLESELDGEELATENGNALNDAELAAIITACKDPVDKVMILSALCFGVKSGELSSLNLRDISGAEICLQAPSGVVKMRIPKQYEDARTELITYYVDNGNNLSGDMPVFLNRSGVRMTRQGLNNRMKNVSESANIGRNVKLADLRATFAQNIYKKTEKNIASVHKYLRLSENTNIMGYLLETQTKEQKTMPVDLMNSLTESYHVKESSFIAEPRQQTPDIIPADTIDSYTLKQLESELQSRGVEFTPATAEIIRGSDMPELKQVAKMLDGEADSIILSGAKLGEIVEQLKPVKKTGFDWNKWLNLGNKKKEQIKKPEPEPVFNTEDAREEFYLFKAVDEKIDNENVPTEIKEIKKVFARHRSLNSAVCRHILQKHGYVGMTDAGILLGMSYAEMKNHQKLFLPDYSIILGYDTTEKHRNGRCASPIWNRSRVEKHFEEIKANNNFRLDVVKSEISRLGENSRDRIMKMSEIDNVSISEKLDSIISAAWIMGNYENK